MGSSRHEKNSRREKSREKKKIASRKNKNKKFRSEEKNKNKQKIKFYKPASVMKTSRFKAKQSKFNPKKIKTKATDPKPMIELMVATGE